MELGIKGKVALVTGTGSQKGMGKAIALTLAKEGCDIVSADMDFEGAQKTAAEVKALGKKAVLRITCFRIIRGSAVRREQM